MKKVMFAVVVAVCGAALFAQQLPTVAVATFDVAGGVTTDEAQVVTELFMTELVSKGTVNVVDRVNFDKIIGEMQFQTSDWSNSAKTAALGRALNAEYVVRGQLMKMGSAIYWTATMIDVKTAQVLYSAREQIADLGQIFDKLPSFTTQITAKIPPTNYFVGKWRASSGSRICILEFKADGRIVVERYDTYAYVNKKRIDRTGTGTGNYSLNMNRIRISLVLTNVADREFNAIATYGDGDPYRFDASKNGFRLEYGLYCGLDPDYETFTKIQ
jgi:TolB-like protein